nr:MAG TPA: hypothetical protein [Caudoviricetes sp.]
MYDCTLESGCIYGLENDEPTEKELREFEEWQTKVRKKQHEF